MKKNNNYINNIEQYRVLYNTLEAYINSQTKCISIISNNNTEGKTTIAKSLSNTLADYSKKTLLIDCNIYESRLENYNSTNEVKLVDIIEKISSSKGDRFNSDQLDEIQLNNLIEPTDSRYLSILSLGVFDHNNSNVFFKAESLKIIIDSLKKEFDYIIIDAPTFETLSYCQIVTSATDGCLFVLKEGINQVSDARIIKEKLKSINCKVLGCILNKHKEYSREANPKRSRGTHTRNNNSNSKGRRNKAISTDN